MVQSAVRTFPQPIDFPPILRGVFTALVDELQTLRRREQQQHAALAHLRSQIDQAAKFQRELLPAHLPRIAGLDIHTLYRPAETVSGDWYDVVRLDEHSTAFLLADATGHGLPAGMVSTLTRRCFQLDSSTRDPATVLDCANRELLRLSLNDCQFVGALHAIYDESTRVMTLARGGLPYPILVREAASPGELPCVGPALGTIDDATFETLEVHLRPGDRLLFRTDGVDALLLEDKGRSLAGNLSSTEWFGSLAVGPLDERLHDLDNALAAARSAGLELDDVTVLALEAV